MAKSFFSSKWNTNNAEQRLRSTFGQLQRDLDVGKIITWAGPRVVKAIKERTTRGRDLNDAAFQPYSTRSAGARKYVRERKGGRTSPVTLQDEGVMMSQLKARAAGNHLERRFSNGPVGDR